MSNIEKIKAEIKRRIKACETKNGFPAGTICAIRIETYEGLLSFINSLPEEIPPYCKGVKGHPDPPGVSDLEGAAEEYASKTLCDPDDGPSVGLVKDAFIAGWNGGIKSQEKKIADAYEKGKQEGIREVRSWESSPGQGGY